MKNTLCILAAVMVFCLPAQWSFAQQAVAAQPLVTTSGSAQIRVVPDVADLFFEVEVRNASLAAARKEQTERVTRILGVLRAAGVPETELAASQVRITPNYTERREETAVLRFYTVSQNISCTLHEVGKIPKVTTEVLEAGATGVRDANLRSTEIRKHRDEARTKAVLAAREKATGLAGALGAKVGAPFSIDEETGNDWRSNGVGYNVNSNSFAGADEAAAAGDGTSPAFAPGTISVTANVRVAFMLESGGK